MPPTTRGRAPLPPGTRRDRQISMNFTTEEYVRIVALAGEDKAGVFCRDIVINRLKILSRTVRAK